jgi:hypothetical protein
MWTSDAVEMGLGPNERTPTSDESMTLNIVEDQPLEEKEKEEGEEIRVSPITTTSDVDDYPDGGLAAWCVVLGVSPPSISPSF